MLHDFSLSLNPFNDFIRRVREKEERVLPIKKLVLFKHSVCYSPFKVNANGFFNITMALKIALKQRVPLSLTFHSALLYSVVAKKILFLLHLLLQSIGQSSTFAPPSSCVIIHHLMAVVARLSKTFICCRY